MDFLKDLNQPKVYELKKVYVLNLNIFILNKIVWIFKAFCLFDLDGDGVISEDDLRNTFLTLGIDKTDAEITKMFDGVGKIQIEILQNI